jgi:hypothetical protein
MQAIAHNSYQVLTALRKALWLNMHQLILG